MPAPSHHSAPLPIASIAGGAAAGVVLAVAAVIGWTCWGRSIKRKERRKRDEEVSSQFPCPSLELLYSQCLVVGRDPG